MKKLRYIFGVGGVCKLEKHSFRRHTRRWRATRDGSRKESVMIDCPFCKLEPGDVIWICGSLTVIFQRSGYGRASILAVSEEHRSWLTRGDLTDVRELG